MHLAFFILAMLPYFQWATIPLGPLTLQVWGLMVALGILLAVLILWKRGKARGFDPEQLLSVTLWMIVVGFVFARLSHVFLYEPAFYLSHPFEILRVDKGGLSSFGGFVGAGLALFWLVKKGRIEKKKLWAMLDQLSFAAIYGWMVARVGCSLTHLHWGVLCEDCPLAINTPEGGRYDMAVLEIIGLIPLAIVFFVLRKRKMFEGFFLAAVMVYYGALRFVLDFFRATDVAHVDARYFGLTPAQYFAIVMVGLGIVFFKKRRV